MERRRLTLFTNQHTPNAATRSAATTSLSQAAASGPISSVYPKKLSKPFRVFRLTDLIRRIFDRIFDQNGRYELNLIILIDESL